MPLPNQYAIPGEKSIASYNYTDIAEGTGTIVFYGGVWEDSTGNYYNLNKEIN